MRGGTLQRTRVLWLFTRESPLQQLHDTRTTLIFLRRNNRLATYKERGAEDEPVADQRVVRRVEDRDCSSAKRRTRAEPGDET